MYNNSVPALISKNVGNTLSNYKTWNGILYNVKQYGAEGDGVTDDTASIQSTINAANAAGGGDVFFPMGKYYCTGVLTIPSNVTLRAARYGSQKDGNSVAQMIAGGVTFYITNTTSAFITLNGQNIHLDGFIFYYPNQVLPTATTPVVYPYTIKNSGGPGIKLSNLTFINAYDAIDLTAGVAGAGRVILEYLWIGALHTGIAIDHALDVVHMSHVQMTPFYDDTNAFPTNLDTWSENNGTGLIIYRADSMFIDDLFIFAKKIGVLLTDSTDTSLSARNSYGTMSNISIDSVGIGISAKSTAAQGWDVQNLQLAPSASVANKIGIQTSVGGTVAPNIRIVGGSSFGNPNNGWLSHNAGNVEFDKFYFGNGVTGGYLNCAANTSLSVIDSSFQSGGTTGVFGTASTMTSLIIRGNRLNGNTSNLTPGSNVPPNAIIKDNDFKIGQITSPAIPATTVAYTNNFGFTARVFVSGGTVTQIAINGVNTGLTSGQFILLPQDTITLTYSAAPSWTWQAL